jgi:hypothetical protein
MELILDFVKNQKPKKWNKEIKKHHLDVEVHPSIQGCGVYFIEDKE